MSKYYSISWAGGEDFDVAYAPNDTPLALLPPEGPVESWHEMTLTLKGSKFADYLANNMGFRLCSERLRDIFEECQSEKDVLQWLDTEVLATNGEKRRYYILHFPAIYDVLDKRRTLFSKGGVLTRPAINVKAVRDHEIFTYHGGGHVTIIVSEVVKTMIKGGGCTGLAYTCISEERKRRLHSPVRGVLRRLACSHRAARSRTLLTECVNKLPGDFEIPELRLPADLVAFLREGMTLEYDVDKCEAGPIVLVSLERLSLGKIRINSFGSPVHDDDPYADEDGYYTVPAVSLAAECNGFDPFGILVWLPNERVFGTWDSDHYDLRVFPEVTWTDIVSDPVKYINAQWHPEGVVNEFFMPWPKYSFTKL